MLQRSRILFRSPTCCRRWVEIDVSVKSAPGTGCLTEPAAHRLAVSLCMSRVHAQIVVLLRRASAC